MAEVKKGETINAIMVGDTLHPIDGVSDKIVTELKSDVTDMEVPSAKCMYDMIGDVETLLKTI